MDDNRVALHTKKYLRGKYNLVTIVQYYNICGDAILCKFEVNISF